MRPATAAPLAVALALSGAAAPARAAQPPQCVVPAKAGGGFELTCRLVKAALESPAGPGLAAPMRITYLPGGVGAVAYEAFVTQRPAEQETLVAFSGGSLLNIALGKFSKYSVDDVRWVAAVGVDYGAVAVRADSPHRTLAGLVAELRAHPRKVTFGIGGTLGGQDWMKAALLARAAGVDPRALRYVSFEGGGDAMVALQAGHVDVVPGDLGEASALLPGGDIRLLAVLADQRLPGRHAAIPTAAEQGLPVSWPTVRGVYMGPRAGAAAQARWAKAFERLLATEEFARLREAHGLLPFSLTGEALEAYVRKAVRDYTGMTQELGLPKR